MNKEQILHNFKTIPQIKYFMQEYNTYTLPIYVLYTLNLSKGVILPTILTVTDLENIIKNFQI